MHRNTRGNCKGKAIENDSIRLINEDIDAIISDLEVETTLKDKIASILFSNLPIKKKRIQIRKLKRKGLEKSKIIHFILLLFISFFLLCASLYKTPFKIKVFPFKSIVL